MDIQDKVNLFMDTELNSYEYSLSDTGTWIVFCHGEPEFYI